jgi:hypothetical protein
MAVKKREVRVKKITGKKRVGDKVYTYTYYTLPLNLYIPRTMVERWGEEYIVEKDEERGIIVIRSKKA